METRIAEFGASVRINAESTIPKIREVVERAVSLRLQVMESALELANEGQKKRIETYLADMLKNMETTPPGSASARQSTQQVVGEVDSAIDVEEVDTETSELEEKHFKIEENDVGFTYDTICRPYIDTATKVTIEDAYIRKCYQIDNLKRFCALCLRAGSVNSIELMTGKDFGEDLDEADSLLENLKRDLASRNVFLTGSATQTSTIERSFWITGGR